MKTDPKYLITTDHVIAKPPVRQPVEPGGVKNLTPEPDEPEPEPEPAEPARKPHR